MNNNFRHIEEAEVITEQEGLSDSALRNWLIKQADKLTRGNKGVVVTEGIILAELAKDSERLRNIFKENPDLFNKYFEQIDFNAITNSYSDILEQPVKAGLKNFLSKKGIPFLTGTIVGVGVSAILVKFKQ